MERWPLQKPNPRDLWIIPIIVAVITTAGAIAVAVISTSGDDSSTETETDAGAGGTVDEGGDAPDIAGDYHLDPDNPRVIIVRSTGVDDAYTIEEELPASWPFKGTIEWTDDGTFGGTATFAAGARMRVTLVPMPDGKLLTTFDFIHDNDGVTIEREDKHLLVPV